MLFAACTARWFEGQRIVPKRLFNLGWAGLLTLLLVIVGHTVALANAPAPPPQAWFYLDYRNAPAAHLEGLQVAECLDSACQDLSLMMQHGRCDRPGCVVSDIDPNKGTVPELRCANNTCLAVLEVFSDRPKSGKFKLIGQFSDRMRMSPPVQVNTPDSPGSFGGTWHVQITDTALALQRDSTLSRQKSWQFFLTGFGLTVLVELAVGALYLQGRKVTERATWVRTLLTVTYLHLATLPVVWFFFPALQPFQYTFSLVFGWICFGVAIAYACLCWFLPRISSLVLGVVTLLGLPVLLLIGLIVAAMFGYGEGVPATTAGLPVWITLPASELFVFLYESLLLHRLSFGKFSLPQATSLSFLANLASLLLGLLFLVPHLS